MKRGLLIGLIALAGAAIFVGLLFLDFQLQLLVFA